MDELDKIEHEVLARIKPSEDEHKHVLDTVDELISKINEVTTQLNIKVEPELVGSVAKGTYLWKPDIDLFVLFSTSVPRGELARYGLEIGRRVLPNGYERYAEHPYITGNYHGYEVDIVPCYKVAHATELKSAVDRTPFHTRYIIEHLQEPQKNDVRLLKQFLKGIGVYGAEIEVQGFSGYLAELLILKYGNFHNLINACAKWKAGKLIKLDPKMAVSNTLLESDDPLIVVDPVDPSRNVASALALQNMAKFIVACKSYIETPKLTFFFPSVKYAQPASLDVLKKQWEARKTSIVGISIRAPQITADVLYGQVRKALGAVVKLCENHGFNVLNSSYFVFEPEPIEAGKPRVASEILLLLEFEIARLPIAYRHVGPHVWHPNATKFLTKWRNKSALAETFSEPYIEDGRWVVMMQRQFTTVPQLISAKLTTINLGKHLNDMVQKNFKIIVDAELFRPPYAGALTKFLIPQLPWDTH